MKEKMRKILLGVIFVMLVTSRLSGYTTVNAQEAEGCNIVVALDVSGSMVKTDENRLSIEMIEMLIDLSKEEDSIAVVAYNDSIVFQSDLISMQDQEKKEQLKTEIRQIEFQGETDNGLGLKTAVDILTAHAADKNSYVLFISDGKTDLANSQTERTPEQSEQDWQQACLLAMENGIRIHTISFVNEYSEETTEMTVVSEKTDGISSVVANPLQFTKVIVQTWAAYQGQKDIKVQTQDILPELTKLEVDISQMESDELTFVAVATENITDFELVLADDVMDLTRSGHYVVAKIQDFPKEKMYALFSGENNGIISWSLIDSGEVAEVEAEVLPLQEEIDLPEEKAPPVALGKMQESLYVKQGKQTFDISTLFEDPDGDIIRYEMEKADTVQADIQLQGTMLVVTPKTDEKITLVLTATDSEGQQVQTEAVFDTVSVWKEYYSLIVWLIISGILILTMVICFFIYRFFFRKEENKVTGFSGVLCASFVDLKSKNDIPPLTFLLEEYPPEEISLKQMLESVGVYEDLPDLDNIRFAPYKKNQIRFVHDTKGGVFIENDLLAAGKVILLDTGTTIYISFAENASEYELRYVAKGMA